MAQMTAAATAMNLCARVAEFGVHLTDLLRPAVAAVGGYAQEVARMLAAADPPAKPERKGRRK
jgi:hypothetical protein